MEKKTKKDKKVLEIVNDKKIRVNVKKEIVTDKKEIVTDKKEIVNVKKTKKGKKEIINKKDIINDKAIINEKNIVNEKVDVNDALDTDKKQIIKMFNENIKGKKIDTSNSNQKHSGKEGHWLEKQMQIKHNANNEPDLFGYEMKKQSNKITFGDFSASEYIFNSHNKREYINKKNNWTDEENKLTREEFFHYFGAKNPLKNNRWSWSGKCVPKYNKWIDNGQIILIEDDNICIYYSYSKDTRNKEDDNLKKLPPYLKKDNLLIVFWEKNKIKNHIEKKFNNKGFFICKKTNDVYDKICFGKKFDYKLFVQYFKTGDIIFDSGMYNGNTRKYSQFRANENFWNKLITVSY